MDQRRMLFRRRDLCPKKLSRQRMPAAINSIREMVTFDEFRQVSTDTLARRMRRVFAASSAGVACIDGVDHVIEFTRSSAVFSARLSFLTPRSRAEPNQPLGNHRPKKTITRGKGRNSFIRAITIIQKARLEFYLRVISMSY